MSDFNLLEEKWIPVYTLEGNRIFISPAEFGRKDLVAIAGERSRLVSGYIQFCIGLLQTVLAPENEEEWKEIYENPPSPSELDSILSPHKQAFNLFGSGPRFMQKEFQVEPGVRGNLLKLLNHEGDDDAVFEDYKIETKKTLTKGQAAAALYQFQVETAGNTGGTSGYSCFRGQGSINVILETNSLWKTLWLNVLSLQDLAQGQSEELSQKFSFPWMSPSYFEEEIDVEHNEANIYSPYWATCRAIWLEEIEEGLSYKLAKKRSFCRAFTSKGKGWLHPLSPYDAETKETKRFRAIHDLKEWTSLRFSANEKPKNLKVYDDKRKTNIEDIVTARIIGSSYPYKAAKLENYINHVFPVYGESSQTFELIKARASNFLNKYDELEGKMKSWTKKTTSQSKDFWKNYLPIQKSRWASLEPYFSNWLFYLSSNPLDRFEDKTSEAKQRLNNQMRDVFIRDIKSLTTFNARGFQREKLNGYSTAKIYKSLLKKLNEATADE